MRVTKTGGVGRREEVVGQEERKNGEGDKREAVGRTIVEDRKAMQVRGTECRKKRRVWRDKKKRQSEWWREAGRS